MIKSPSIETINEKIILIRQQKVMLDWDLAGEPDILTIKNKVLQRFIINKLSHFKPILIYIKFKKTFLLFCYFVLNGFFNKFSIM